MNRLVTNNSDIMSLRGEVQSDCQQTFAFDGDEVTVKIAKV
jgi:hypothetical protein